MGGKRCGIDDVGGERSRRKKWCLLCDEVTAVIFVAVLVEDDRKLQEDRRRNCMEEAIGLFKTVVNHDAFKKVLFLLFLNKKDLFEEKIPLSSIQDQKEFSDYSGLVLFTNLLHRGTPMILCTVQEITTHCAEYKFTKINQRTLMINNDNDEEHRECKR